MDYSKMHEHIRRMLEDDPDSVSILEEKVDVDEQVRYFRYSQKAKQKLKEDTVMEHVNLLHDQLLPIKYRRFLLCLLASVPNVEAYRAIEAYAKNPDEKLVEWVALAKLESRMMVQASLTNKSPVIISSGLGGKGLKLRYFVVFVSSTGVPFTEMQKKLIEGEFSYLSKKSETEVEEIAHLGNFSTATVLISLKDSVQSVLSEVVNQCNELGDFILDSFMVTNVKKLSDDEICASIDLMDSGEDVEEDEDEDEDDDTDEDDDY